MAKKKAKPVEAVLDPTATKPIRLEMSESDHARIKRAADARGLSKAAYARQAVLQQIRRDEQEGAE
jgi:hypothetical protein